MKLISICAGRVNFINFNFLYYEKVIFRVKYAKINVFYPKQGI